MEAKTETWSTMKEADRYTYISVDIHQYRCSCNSYMWNIWYKQYETKRETSEETKGFCDVGSSAIELRAD